MRSRESGFEEIICAQLGGAHCRLDGAVAGDDDDFRASNGVEFTNILQYFQSIAIGQPDIQQYGIENGIANQVEPFGCSTGGGDGVAFLGEDRLQSAANIRLVVDHKDVIHRSTTLIEGAEISDGDAESAKGIRMTKRAPVGELDSTWIFP